jgi:uncharacterized integral membrane protein
MSDESPGSDDSNPEFAEAPIGPNLAPSEHGDQIGRTRISGVWLGLIIGVVVLVFLLVFIIQNSKSVKVSFFTVSGNMPLGAALLLAVAGGVLLAGIVASLRIGQLRHRRYKSERANRSTFS